jgi:hypothetical protein
MILTPLAARPRAIPSPIPLVEPVTMADFPDNMGRPIDEGDAQASEKRAVCRDAQLLAALFDNGMRHFRQGCDSTR